MSKIKLTNAQREFLAETAKGLQCAVEGYRPAVRLVSLGLIQHRAGKFGSVFFEITPAGRSALAALEGGEQP